LGKELNVLDILKINGKVRAASRRGMNDIGQLAAFRKITF
jgi:hypothetical protein